MGYHSIPDSVDPMLNEGITIHEEDAIRVFRGLSKSSITIEVCRIVCSVGFWTVFTFVFLGSEGGRIEGVACFYLSS